MSSDSVELQREVATVVLAAIEREGFALAGSGAIREHGLIDRPTEDVDLFTASTDEAGFARAVTRVRHELDARGYRVGADTQKSGARFARFHIVGANGARTQLDLAMDWREWPAVTLDIGPVLDLDDAVFNKVGAVYTRAEVRDFLDLDSIRSSGRYTDSDLIAGVAGRDAGFDLRTFASQLERAGRIEPAQVARYDVSSEQLAAIRSRILAWADALRRAAGRGDALGPE